MCCIVHVDENGEIVPDDYGPIGCARCNRDVAVADYVVGVFARDGYHPGWCVSCGPYVRDATGQARRPEVMGG